MTQEKIEAGAAGIEVDENGLVRVIFPAGAEVVLEDMIKINEQIRKIGGGKKMPVLTDIKKIKSVTREAREFPSGEEAEEVTAAVAILIGSPASRVIGNFHLKLNKPPFPARLFNSETEAVKWLKSFSGEAGA